MKKIRVLIFTLMLFMIGGKYVYAACDATEMNTLNSLAANVGKSYEVIEREVSSEEANATPPDGLTIEEYENYVFVRKFFRIYITNITEELYVVVTNENTGEEKTFNYADTDNGSVYFDERVGTEIVNYTIDIYSSDITNCRDQRLYTQYLTTPMYNLNSESGLCEGIEDFYLCHEYLSVDVDFTNFMEKTEEYRASHTNGEVEEDIPVEENANGFIAFVQEHWLIVLGISVAVLAAGGLITFVVIKKRRSRIV